MIENDVIKIGTRASQLAVWQAEHVKALIENKFPNKEVQLIKIVTKGDKILDKPLMEIGGKGLFLKELETALVNGEADIAVHSMKDVPFELPEGLEISCILERADPFDAFVSNKFKSFHAMPKGSVVGTSSLRRAVQIKRQFPDFKIKDLRGNVGTRLGKLDAEEFDAIVLACAGLKRLGLEKRISKQLTDFIPAVSQGAIGIECRQDDEKMKSVLQEIHHKETSLCVEAERYFMKLVEGSCHIPLGCYVIKLEGLNYSVKCFYSQPDGSQYLEDHFESEYKEIFPKLESFVERCRAKNS